MEQELDQKFLLDIYHFDLDFIYVIAGLTILRWIIPFVELVSYVIEFFYITKEKRETFQRFGVEHTNYGRYRFIFSFKFFMLIVSPLLSLSSLLFIIIVKKHTVELNDLKHLNIDEMKLFEKTIYYLGVIVSTITRCSLAQIGPWLIFVDITYTLVLFKRINLVMWIICIFTPYMMSMMNWIMNWNQYVLIPFLSICILGWRHVKSWLYFSEPFFAKLNKENLPRKVQYYLHNNTHSITFYTTYTSSPNFFSFKHRNENAVFLTYPENLFREEEIAAILFHEIHHIEQNHVSQIDKNHKYAFIVFMILNQMAAALHKARFEKELLGVNVFYEIYFLFCAVYVPLHMIANYIAQKKEISCDLFATSFLTPTTVGKALIQLYDDRMPFYYTFMAALIFRRHPSLYRRLEAILEHSKDISQD